MPETHGSRVPATMRHPATSDSQPAMFWVPPLVNFRSDREARPVVTDSADLGLAIR